MSRFNLTLLFIILIFLLQLSSEAEEPLNYKEKMPKSIADRKN